LECITSVAQYANTTFWKEDPNEQGFFYEWLVHVSADPNPPHVLSMSYDLLESDPRYVDEHLYNIQCSEMCTLRYEKLHTET
jgi:hypothetical protein